MSDMAASVVAANQAQTQQTAQLKMVKQQHEMAQATVDMLAQAVEGAKAPAPSGQGLAVDKSA